VPFEEPSRLAPKSTDRKLGDEWIGWDGTIQTNDTRTPQWVYLGLAGLLCVLLAAGGAGFLWLIYPRLQNLGLAWLTSGAVVVGGVYLISWYFLLLGSSSGRSQICQTGVKWLGGIGWTMNAVILLGKFFGLSRDQVGHAFILIHNQKELLPSLARNPERLLMLLPRCLSPEIMQALRKLQQQYGFTQVIAAGGTEARKAIASTRPLGVLAVACERDLLVGIKDLHGRIPVLAFANQRPEGPCKNTGVDMPALEKAVQVLLGKNNIK
jgi:uncharacterized protein